MRRPTNWKIWNILIFLLFLFTEQYSYAQDTIKINSIIIIENKNLSQKGIIATQIDSIILSENIENNLSEILSKSSNIFIKNYGKGSISTASFRGTSATHTQVIWNNIKLNSPMMGQVNFSAIPIFFIDDITILHGGSSLTENSGALGGIVNIKNKTDWNNKFSIKAIQKVASFGTYASFANISVGTKKMQFKTRVFSENSKNNFKYINNSEPDRYFEKQKNADYKKRGIMQEAYFRTSQKSFASIILWGQQSNGNIPSIMSYSGMYRKQNQIDNQLKTIVSYNINFEKINLKINSGYVYDNINYFLADSTNISYIIKNNSNSNSNSLFNNAEIKYLHNSNNELKLDFFYNYDFVNIYDSATYSLTKYNATRQENGLKFSYHKKINSRFAGFVLLHQKMVSKKIVPIIPSIGLDYQLLKNKPLFIKTNISRNYNMPTLNDLYWMPGGNPNLLQEIGYSADVNLEFTNKFKNNIIKNSASIYASLIDNWIVWRPSEFRYWTAQNIKKVFARGIEYSFNIEGRHNKIKYQIIGNYAFTKTTNQKTNLTGDKSIGQQLIYIPKNTFGLFGTTSLKGYYSKIDFNYIGKRYTTSSNLENRHTLPPYSICNINFGKNMTYKKTNFNIKLTVNNLFNNKYQTILYRAMPMRNYSMNLRFEF